MANHIKKNYGVLMAAENSQECNNAFEKFWKNEENS